MDQRIKGYGVSFMDEIIYVLVGVVNPKDGTLHLVTLMLRILVIHLTQTGSGIITWSDPTCMG